MLILNRKHQERIYIGNNIIIEVLDCQGSHVRLGIDAPADIKIYREELLDRQSMHEVDTLNDQQ